MSLGDDILQTAVRTVKGVLKGAIIGGLIGLAVGAIILAAPIVAGLTTVGFVATFAHLGVAFGSIFGTHAAVAGAAHATVANAALGTVITPLAIGGAIGAAVVGAASIIPGVKSIMGIFKRSPQAEDGLSAQPDTTAPAVGKAEQVNVNYDNAPDRNWQQTVDQSRAADAATGKSV
jgi:hypothetical protein